MRKIRARSAKQRLRATGPRRAGAGRSATAGRRRQRDVLCDVLLSARECDTWLTLDELAKLTHYPPASISAQLRHLRKPQFGGYEVRKQQRISGKVLRGEDFGTVWEYQLRRAVRRVVERHPRKPQAAQPVAAAA